MKARALLIILYGLSIILILTGCMGTASPGPGGGNAPAPQYKFNIIAGTIGGGTNVLAQSIAAVAKKYMDIDSTILSGMAMAFTSTIQSGVANIGTTPALTQYQAYTGKGPWEGKPWKGARTLWWGFEAELQILVPSGSDIKDIRDLKGKTISTGTKGFLADQMFADICRTLGIQYGKDINIVYMSHEEAAAAFGSRIAAYVLSGGIPQPTFVTVDMTRPVTILKFTDADLKAIQADQPYMIIRKISKGAYKGMTDDVFILSHPYSLGTADTVPEQVAYDLTRFYIENADYVGTVYKPAQVMITDGRGKTYTAERVAAPFHPGSYKYFKEKGWTVHPDMVPPSK